MDVVLADGSNIHVTSTNYPDIYYALRGAADSFGIVTTFYLQTQPAPSQVTSYSANFQSALKSVDNATDIILKLQRFATKSPYMNRDTYVEVRMNVYGNFTVSGWYFGDRDFFANTVRKYLYTCFHARQSRGRECLKVFEISRNAH